MTKDPQHSGSTAPSEPHQARGVAESFGADPGLYHRTRPRYPDEMIGRILAGTPGTDVLDVGIGTGVSAKPFVDAGSRVLGVEVDPRMAEFARQRGFEVEVGRFEDWDDVGRTFDLLIAGQAWHWVDPVAGAGKAAHVLRQGGRIALFWNVFEPPAELGKAFAAVYRRVLPGTPFAAGAFGGMALYARQFDSVADGSRRAGGFAEPEQWRVDWQQRYTRDEWLAMVPTAGGHNRFPANTLAALLDGLGGAIDAVGGAFTMEYVTVAVTALRDR